MSYDPKNYIELSTKEDIEDDLNRFTNFKVFQDKSNNTVFKENGNPSFKNGFKFPSYRNDEEENLKTSFTKKNESKELFDEINEKDFEIDKTFNEEKLSFKLETPHYDKEIRELRNKDGFYYFKFTLCILFTLVYTFTFLYNLPTKLIKKGSLEEIDILMKDPEEEANGILITNLNSTLDLIINNEALENQGTNSVKYKLLGYFLEEITDNIFIFKWFIGLFYFTFRNYLFLHSHDIYSGNFISQNRISILHNLTTFLFPLYLFYYSQRYSSSRMIKIKEDILNPNLSLYIESQNNGSFFSSFDTLFPMIHFFITSMIFNQFEQALGKLFLKLKFKGH